MSEGATASTAALLGALGVAKRRPRRMPDQVYPSMVELEYANALVGRLRMGIEDGYAELLHALPAILTEAEEAFARGDERVDAGAAARASELLAGAYRKLIRWFNPGDLEGIAREYGDRTSRHQRQQLARQLLAGLGVNVPIADLSAFQILQFFVLENVTKIAGVVEMMFQQIANVVTTAFSRRTTHEALVKQINERFDVAESYARGIAQQQIGKLNGQLNRARQQELGITGYIWITKDDPKVRDAHRPRHLKRFAWNNPPRGGHPGEDYGCRCKGRPDVQPLLEQIASARAAALTQLGALPAPLNLRSPSPVAFPAPMRLPTSEPAEIITPTGAVTSPNTTR